MKATMRRWHRMAPAIMPVLICLATGCLNGSNKKSYDEIGDSGLTMRTENLRDNLPAIASQGVMFGQIGSTLYGAGWEGDSLRSDIKSVCGDHVSCTGYEIADARSGTDMSGTSLDAIRRDILSTVKRGCMTIIRWYVPHYSEEKELEAITASMAQYLESLQDDYGKRAPIVLLIMPRVPDQWYQALSAKAYQQQYTHIANKLRERGTCNIVAGYSCELSVSDNAWRSYMPKHDIAVIDVTVPDISEGENRPEIWQTLTRKVRSLVTVAKQQGCAAGITMGDYGEKDSVYWSQKVLPLIADNGLAYALFRENRGSGPSIRAACPYPGSSDTDDFMRLYNDKRTLFAHDLNGLYLSNKQ